MNNSNDIGSENPEEPPTVDYSKLPEELEEIISKQSYIVEKKVKLTFDGRQFIVRIPKEIAKERGISTENQIVFRLVKPRPDSENAIKLEIELI